MSDSQLLARLDRIESALHTLLQQRVVQAYYSTADAAQWCRHGRIQAVKRACGRGSSLEWMIPHSELERVRAEGLLPAKH